MRLTVKRDEPGFLLWELLAQAGRIPRVFFDGLRQDHCIAVDDLEGWIERAATNPNGAIKVRNGEVVVEKLYGKVCILLDPEVAR